MPRSTFDVINVLAILLSPLIAVLTTMYLQRRKERRDSRRAIFTTLVATRHSAPTEEKVRALNMIDVVFYDCASVRALWRAYFDMLNNPGLNNALGAQQRVKKFLELLAEMATVLGYKNKITHLDIDRVYYPEGLGRQNDRAESVMNELLRVLKGTSGFSVGARDASPTSPHVASEPAPTELSTGVSVPDGSFNSST
ncbi:MAG TPA: DUF6680 family protein [Gemmatimonadaceae bacterium]|nr:DUF6680 family protein [Gemmatimonadaceae bacterium]